MGWWWCFFFFRLGSKDLNKKNTGNMVTHMHLMGDVYYYLYICVCIYALVWVFGLRNLFPDSTLDPTGSISCVSP